MSLPLIERAREDGVTFVMSGMASPTVGGRLYEINLSPAVPLIPKRPLQPGEQYRFHFDMTQCIGCRCCIVACNEQNGNPADINWRRVGEIEGGFYPDTQRFHLSMGCNHCLEPSCLIGCPVDAYKKDPVTGIVQHSPETCIGCQYCLRRTAVQPGTGHSRQMRHVLRAVDRRARTGLRQCVSRERDSDRDRQYRRMETGIFQQRKRPRASFRRRQHFDHAHHPAGKSSA